MNLRQFQTLLNQTPKQSSHHIAEIVVAFHADVNNLRQELLAAASGELVTLDDARIATSTAGRQSMVSLEPSSKALIADEGQSADSDGD
jgi:hypothetical protein